MWSQPDWDRCYELISYDKETDSITVEIKGIVNDEYYSNEQATIRVDKLLAFIEKARKGEITKEYLVKGSGVKDGDEDE